MKGGSASIDLCSHLTVKFTMNDNKFATFGQKLDVKSEDLPPKNREIWVKKAGLFLAQGLALAVSSVFGLLWGFTEHSYQSSYPFHSMSGLIGVVGLVGIDTANWKLTTKRDSKVGSSLKGGVKIPILLLNVVFGFVGYLVLFGVTASSDNLSAPMLYGVHTEDQK